MSRKIKLSDEKIKTNDLIGWICLKICEKFFPEEYPKEKKEDD